MASKQRSPRQSQNPSPAPSQSTIQSLIFANVYFNGKAEDLLNGLRHNYKDVHKKGVKNVIPLYLEDNNGKLIRAIRIDVERDDLAKQFIDESKLCIDDQEYSFQSLSTRSLIVSKVAAGEKEAKLLQDLAHNYIGAEKISRFYDTEKKSVDNIRIDFKSDSLPAKIIKDGYILIDGKRCPVQPYWSFVYTPSENQNEQDHPSEQSQTSRTRRPQKYLTEQRVMELFREQQM
jgi:hypothetical protein